MRILFFARSLERGGAERQLVATANGLAARGHTVSVALFYSGGGFEQDLCHVPLLYLKKSGRWDIFGFCLRLIHAVKTFQPDVIYSFLGIPNILAAALKLFWRRAHIVWSARASDMDYTQYDRIAALAHWLEARCAWLADLIVANSSTGLEHCVLRGMPREKLIVIPNGIDTDRFIPKRDAGAALRQQWAVQHKAILIGLVARIDPMKDHETFLRAARVVLNVDADIRFVCIGSGNSNYVTEIMALAHKLELDDFLIWAGEYSAMEDAYNALDICCLSSITEGFPNVVGEAMSCGVPCVVTKVGDAPSIVGKTGRVSPKRDPIALATAILQVIALIRADNAGDPRQRILAYYSVEQMILKTEYALQTCLE